MKNTQLIATNLITGFLGSGKTTAILNLLRSRANNSSWAVLVNEFGEVGIDGTILAGDGLNDGVYIKEVPGGCLCCAAGLPLQIALNLLIKKARPQRILIEPTGLGHPKKVLDVLTGEFYKNVLDLKATICLLEAEKLRQAKYMENETFRDQINIADVVLASKADLSSKVALDYFQQFFQQFTPAKAHIEAIEFGRFSVQLLDIDRNKERYVNYPKAHPKHKYIKQDVDAGELQQAVSSSEKQLNWQRFENNGQGFYGCGWIFDLSICFDSSKLEQLFNDDAFSRIKGVFRTDRGCFLLNRSGLQFEKRLLEQCDDSRIEIIDESYHDWNQLEILLLDCIYSKL